MTEAADKMAEVLRAMISELNISPNQRLERLLVAIKAIPEYEVEKAQPVQQAAELTPDQIEDIWAAQSPIDGADMDIHAFARAVIAAGRDKTAA